MASLLPARPNLDHLKHQAKTLLADLKSGSADAAQAFIAHLPAARDMSADDVRAAGFRLADAQSVVARQTGFAGWPALSRYVQHLRALEGEWRLTSLQVDGASMPREVHAAARLLFDGDRFRMESAEANYEGVFTIDVEAQPMQIDIEFVEGPEAGNHGYGLFDLDEDDLTLCLGVVGAPRPTAFVSTPGSGHALERLRRVSAERPANVTGGTRQPAAAPVTVDREDPAAFDVEMTPLLRRLEGEWTPVQLVTDGKPMPDQWLAFGSRTCAGNDIKVVFGGQVMVHAKVRIDEAAIPMAVDYLHLSGGQKGAVSHGILEWVEDEARFLMAAPGQPRPRDFGETQGTLSQWRRRT